MRDCCQDNIELNGRDRAVCTECGWELDHMEFVWITGRLMSDLAKARAKVEELEAETVRLTALIDEHNREMQEVCGHHPMCSKLRAIDKRCAECPLDYLIDTTENSDQ